MNTVGSKLGGYILLLLIQATFVVVYGIFVRYEDRLLPSYKNATEYGMPKMEHVASYPHFQDIHVMIFVGFAFLMTFLRKYGYSATGFNLFVGALVVQWAFLARGCFELEDGYIKVSLDSMIGADIAAATVLISMGALLGRTTPIQLLLIGLVEIAIFACNEHLQLGMLKIADVGGSITVHSFGAYYGLAVSFILRPKPEQNASGKLENASYTSDIFAMVGTLFLWMFWPSFNSVLLDGVAQERAIINTYLALASATVTTFIVSAIVNHDHKLDMVHVQNSTLAGGVAVGSVCNMLIGPHGALLIGLIAGIVSVLGYRYLTPIITSTLRIHDTCGVHNLHGMPAILSALFSAIYASLATAEKYQDSLAETFPAMEMRNMTNTNGTFIVEYGRTSQEQAGYQIIGIALTVAIAIVTGLLTGFCLRLPGIRHLSKDEHHDDEIFWEVSESELVVRVP